MNDIEKRARALLIAHLRANEYLLTAEAMDLGKEGYMPTEIAATAIISAFTPPEGYEQALQDAARYRYIREIAAGEPSAFGQIEDAAFAAHYGNAAQFDLNIDDQMAARPEVSP